MNKEELMKRLKNPIFIAAVASILYQALSKYNVAPSFGDYQLYVDLVCYTFGLGGVYSVFKTDK